MAPKKTQIEYFFCQNPECSVHTSALVGKLPPDSPIQEGKPCPRCGKTIEKILIEETPSVASTGKVTVLPGEPYGGFMLQRGDDDSSKTWQGAAQSDPRHEGAHYVAEFQHDMLRIAHYGPARGGETLGKFGLQLMGCVLDLKKHLKEIHGLTFNADLNVVNAAAGTSGAPVHFPPAGLVSPSEALGQVTEWQKILGQSRSDNKLLNQLKVWDKQWSELVKFNAPLELKEVDSLRQGNATQAQELKALTKDRAAAAKTVATAESEISKRSFARQKSTLSEADVAQVETAAAAAATQGNDVGQRLTTLAEELSDMDSRIPTKSTSKDPTDKAVVVPPPAAGPTLDARFDQANEQIKALRKANNNQLTWIQYFNGLQQQLKTRLDRLGKKLRELDKLVAGLISSLDSIGAECIAAEDASRSLNQFSQGKSGKETQELKNARQRVSQWLDDPDGSKKGSLQQCAAFIVSRSAELVAGGLAPPQQWPLVAGALGQLTGFMSGFNAEINQPTAAAWADGYKEQLIVFGTLDKSTARYVKEMAVTGLLNGKHVFRVPFGDEVKTLKQQGRSVNSELSRLLDEALQSSRIKRAAGDGPAPILKFIFAHESGGQHVGKFAGKEFVKLGIDWPNSATSNASFDETRTPGGKLSTSRGWGATQLTLFSKTNEELEDKDGKNQQFNTISGIPTRVGDGSESPMPALIVSEERNVFGGMVLYLGNFQASPIRRECSFEPSSSPVSGHSYKCDQCAKLLKTGPSQKTGGGVVTFDESLGDFDRIAPQKGKSLPLYRVREMDRLRGLLSTGKFKLADGRTAEQAKESDLDEFPCSWLACISRYAGVSRRGFDYMLEGIQTMAK